MEMTLKQYLDELAYVVNSAGRLRNVWVTAEMSDVRTATGHCYLELLQKDDEGRITAKVRATIWRGTFMTLNDKFLRATGRNISTGLKVMVCGTASMHPLYGLAFNIIDIDPSYTLGDVERRRREILQTLQREGILELNKQKTLPPDSQRIAVISGGTAAGYGDFVRQLSENSGGYVFYPHLFPAIVQGERTSESVREALAMIEMTIDLWDCVVIIRGGGATTDLLGFDDLALARTVARFPIPVIVGIGHERDNTALDYIAHTRCKTPTAVAAFLIDRLAASEKQARDLATAIARTAGLRLDGEKQLTARMQTELRASAQAALQRTATDLRHMAEKLPMLASARLTRENDRITAATRMALTAARSAVGMRLTKTDDYARTIPGLIETALLREKNRLDALQRLAEALDPRATLRRGYSITRIDGHALTSAAQVTEGQTITTTLADGTITSKTI